MNEMMPEVGQFATTGTLNAAFLRRNSKVLMPKGMVVYCAVCLITAILSAWLYAQTANVNSLITALLMLALAIGYPWRYYRSWLKTSVARLKENAPEGEMIITVSCSEQGVRIENQTSGGTMTIAYESVACAIETEDALMIKSRANQITAFFKSSLTEQECEELKAFLRAKGVKVKG